MNKAGYRYLVATMVRYFIIYSILFIEKKTYKEIVAVIK